ncbi:methyl-accepting chemotaxis protein, partial [Stenotrophomonas maltophilia]
PTHPGPALLATPDHRPSAVAVAVASKPACRRQRRSRRCKKT